MSYEAKQLALVGIWVVCMVGLGFLMQWVIL